MTNSNQLPGAADAERHELLTHFKNLGLITDSDLALLKSASHEDFQKSIEGLQNRKKEYQDNFRQLISIKDVIEKHLSRLISEMLDGRDVLESLQQGMKIYPSLQFVSWLVEEREGDFTEFIKDLGVDSDYALPILYRWKYEYQPLRSVWRELEARQRGSENRWTLLTPQNSYYNQSRNWPQLSFRLLAGTNIIWNGRDDIDDIMRLGRGFLRICLAVLRESQEYRNLSPIFLEGMRDIVSTTEEIINQLKALPILSSQKASEDSTDTQ